MKSFLFEYFRYTRSERNGILFLGAICISLITFYHFQSFLFAPDFKSLEEYEEIYCSMFQEIEPEPIKEIKYFSFDPNTISKEDLMKMGISAKASQTLLNYRKSGAKIKKADDLLKVYGFNKSIVGKLKPYMSFSKNNASPPLAFGDKPKEKKETVLFQFNPNSCSKMDFEKLGLNKRVINTIMNFREKVEFKKPEDFKKIYGLSEEKFNELLPYLNLPTPLAIPKKVYEKPVYAKKEKKIIDVNNASEEEWQEISGIGPTFSKRIVKFRGKLGGFHSIDQVAETFGMSDSTFQVIKPYLKIEKNLSKININEVELEELRSHPYLKWKHAKVLINYRNHHGPYGGKEDLKKVKILKEEQLEKILPYISFEKIID